MYFSVERFALLCRKSHFLQPFLYKDDRSGVNFSTLWRLLSSSPSLASTYSALQIKPNALLTPLTTHQAAQFFLTGKFQIGFGANLDFFQNKPLQRVSSSCFLFRLPYCVPAVGQEVNSLLSGRQLAQKHWHIFCLFPHAFIWLFLHINWPATKRVFLDVVVSLHGAHLVKTEISM